MDRFKNFLTRIEDSVGSNLFRSYYVDGVDVLENGDLSCAFFVSQILHMSGGLIEKPHCTVSGTISDMKKSGWYQISKPRKGCVVVWNPIIQNGNSHFHIGFYLGRGQAISNRSSMGFPGEHSLRYTGLDKNKKTKKVKISALYWHDALG